MKRIKSVQIIITTEGKQTIVDPAYLDAGIYGNLRRDRTYANVHHSALTFGALVRRHNSRKHEVKV